MGFKLLILRTGAQASSLGMEGLTDRLRAAVPDIEVNVADSDGEAMEVIEEVDAAFGIVSPQLLERAKKLRWIASAQAGPKAGYYYSALVESDVVVTNAREIYNDHIGAHIMAYVLAFAKGLHLYMPLPAPTGVAARLRAGPSPRDHRLDRWLRGNRRGGGASVLGLRHDRRRGRPEADGGAARRCRAAQARRPARPPAQG